MVEAHLLDLICWTSSMAWACSSSSVACPANDADLVQGRQSNKLHDCMRLMPHSTPWSVHHK
eukprot:1727977-Lingulodinium_polyedra.AAC.1